MSDEPTPMTDPDITLGTPAREEDRTRPDDCGCPVCGTFQLLGSKWTTHILGVVYEEDEVRFNALKRELDGISSRMLSDRLDELEEHGLVERVDYDEVPPRVEYHATEKGESMVEALTPFLQVVEEHAGEE